MPRHWSQSVNAKTVLEYIHKLEEDKDRFDWLDEQIVDSIYLDDGRMIDNRGNSIRTTIDTARKRETANVAER